MTADPMGTVPTAGSDGATRFGLREGPLSVLEPIGTCPFGIEKNHDLNSLPLA